MEGLGDANPSGSDQVLVKKEDEDSSLTDGTDGSMDKVSPGASVSQTCFGGSGQLTERIANSSQHRPVSLGREWKCV